MQQSPHSLSGEEKPVTDTEQALLDSISNMPMLDQVMDWAKVNSGTRNLDGLATMAKLLSSAFSILPGKLSLVDPDPVEVVNADGSKTSIEHGKHLKLSVRPEAAVRILLTGHMDTVFPIDHPFQSLHWIEEGVLGGPGVADMKGGISVMLAALITFEQSDEAANLGYDVMINSDEEVGSASSARLIKELAAGKCAALTYEPSALPDGTLAGARGGSGNYSITITGKSAHAGRNPTDGRNAIVAAADLAVQLKGIMRDGLSVNPAKIDGGGPNNVVPDLAILRVNFRPRELADQAEAEQAVSRITAIIAKNHGVEVEVHGGFGRPPKPIDAQAERLFNLVKTCGKQLGLDIGWKSTGGVCDGNNIAACGVPVVDTMGVRGGSIHSSDEFMIADSLVERAQLSALTMLRISQQGGL